MFWECEDKVQERRGYPLRLGKECQEQKNHTLQNEEFLSINPQIYPIKEQDFIHNI